MDTLAMRELVHVPGPFTSVYLPSAASWRSLRGQLTGQHVDESILDTIDAVLRLRGSTAGLALVAASGRVLVDESPSWPPREPIARVSDLPYLLPLVHRYATPKSDLATADAPANEPPAADRSAYDQFVFESSRPGGLAVDGLPLCTRTLREDNADLLVISVDRLGDKKVWVGGERMNLVSTDDSLRGQGTSITRQRADEALPMAAFVAGADVIVTSDPLPLADGVGVLLRHPEIPADRP